MKDYIIRIVGEKEPFHVQADEWEIDEDGYLTFYQRAESSAEDDENEAEILCVIAAGQWVYVSECKGVPA